MAKREPEKFDFDTKMLGVFTEATEQFISAYEDGKITAETCVAGISDLITITKNVPRSVTITLDGSVALQAIQEFKDRAEETENE